MKNKLNKALVLMALATTLNLGTVKAEANEVKIVKGFNAVELATETKNGNTRIRTLTNIDAIANGAVIGYTGLTEIYNNDTKTIFTYGKVRLADKDTKNQLVYAFKADKYGIFDEKAGVRILGACKTIGLDYGKLDVLVNKNAAETDLFCGKGIGKGTTLELYQAVQKKFGKKTTNYTELQLNKDIAKNTALFARMEAPNFKKPTYLAGIAKRF